MNFYFSAIVRFEFLRNENNEYNKIISSWLVISYLSNQKAKHINQH